MVVRVRPPLPRELRGTGLRPYQCTTHVDTGRICTISENLPAVLQQVGGAQVKTQLPTVTLHLHPALVAHTTGCLHAHAHHCVYTLDNTLCAHPALQLQGASGGLDPAMLYASYK